jgi:hypothetical protein
MKSSVRVILVAVAVLTVAACSNLATANRSASVINPALAAAFATVPVGFTSTQNSFDSSAAPISGGWFPEAPMGGMGREEGRGPGAGVSAMIGGGLGEDFLGGMGLGMGFGHGRFGDSDLDGGSCAFVVATGRVTCAPVTHEGITITSSVAYTTTAGTVQSAFDSLTTNSINTQISVTGSKTRRDSSTTTVSDSSDRTVSGLAKGSTQHTVNGTALGSETTSGKDSTGAFVAVRVTTDTTSGIIVPVSDTGRTYPTAGTIIRAMSVSLTYSGKPAQTSARREVITYDGTSTAKLVITQNGTTKNCTLPLPFGHPTCQ